MTEAARDRREQIHWLAAASGYRPPEAVIARWSELERKARKDARLDQFLARVSREKKAREAAQN